MPTLEWIGKDKVVNHHQEVPYRVLERQYSYDEAGQHTEDNGSENMIIHGDNLEALKALLPRYEGKIKCIYIDPPYNTAHSTDDNRRWIYNDNVDSPEIRKWIGKIVGDEGEDLSRHDKWLCMMYPRLKLLQRFLSEDGIIFISISDVEHAHLRILCDEIFGSRNLVSNIIWQNNFSPRNDAKDIAYVTDNILAYSKNPGWHPKKLTRSDDMDARYDTPDNDPTPWTSSPAHAPSARTHKGMVYAIQHPYTGALFYPPSGRCWANEQAKMLKNMKMWADYKLEQIDDVEKRAQICGEIDIASMPDVKAILLDEPVESSREKVQTRIQMGLWPPFYFTNNGQGGMRVKKYLDRMDGKVVTTLWPYEEVGSNTEAKNELKKIFGGQATFDTPKPERLIERILQIAGDEEVMILDSFAGSGTTAHAVLKMNKTDGGNRKFILVEMMDYADSITAQRVKRAISGYKADIETVLYDKEITVKNLAQGAVMLEEARTVAKEAKGKHSSVKSPKIEEGHLRVITVDKAKDMVDGLGGNFSYYELGPVLLLPDGNLNEEVDPKKIREYVYYMETKEPLTAEQPTDEPYFMGLCRNTAYYFYYERENVTTLDHAFLATIQTKAEGYTIYADLCAIPQETLRRHNITFKKIPRDIAQL